MLNLGKVLNIERMFYKNFKNYYDSQISTRKTPKLRNRRTC